MSTGWILGILLILLIFIAISVYNKLVRLKNLYLNAFSQIEVQLERRYDLIPNLVESSKAYLKHESDVLERVIQARNNAHSSLVNCKNNLSTKHVLDNLNQAEASLSHAFRQFSMLVESYPELKANETIQSLIEELSNTENRVSFARQAFNDSAMFYNSFRQSFPAVILAASFGHSQNVEYFQTENKAEKLKAPKVSF
ncbi:LemA family protein [Catenovulum sp. SM1970]|uniref:LemA family protein n=1 Tax=Marinifaba aquimaris TaxID=2741323 RepID=UPI001574623A|nr:LemA family protein [Marinifaba aquimaris]NTS77724.1 LemA family protein [Marinifaba aquimaris]